MSYRDKAARNLKQIGQELGVANVLEGSVRRVKDRVLVNVQLIDTATDQHLWAERYDRTLADSITLQGELASEIARALQATLSPQEKARVQAKPTDNPEAYVAYLRGLELQSRADFSHEAFRSALGFYKQALALDPGFVEARARLSYVQGVIYQYFEPANNALLAEARANADDALRLDANSAEGHLSLALWALLSNDKATARQELDAAGRLLPNDAFVAMTAANIQSNYGWQKEAAANYERAIKLGPREPKIFFNYGVLLNEMGKVAEARTALDRSLALDPDSFYMRIYRAWCEVRWTGDIARAKAILARAPPGKDPDGRLTSAACSLALAQRNFPEALRLLRMFPGETLPAVGHGGFAMQLPKAHSEGLIRLWSGDRERAYACFNEERWRFEATAAENPTDASACYNVAYVSTMMGWKEAALAEIARLLDLEKEMPAEERVNLAEVYTWNGELDLAWQEIAKTLSDPENVIYANVYRLDPRWDPLRKNPRFQKFLATHKP